MQLGPPRGESVSTTLNVTKTRVEDVPGHSDRPVLGTSAVLAAVTDVARGIIEPHLGEHEVAVTSSFEIQHRAPVPQGSEAELVVTVAQVGPARMLCDFVVRHNGTVAARGSYDQSVLDTASWHEAVEATTD